MSYGRWTKRGIGWCSVEIDSPWNGECLDSLRSRSPRAHGFLISQLERAEIRYGTFEDDVASLSFEARHRLNGRDVARFEKGGGEHTTWVAYDSVDALKRALKRLTSCPIERAEVLWSYHPELAPQPD